MVNLADIVGDFDIILLFDDMGYELHLERADEGVVYLTCPDLEDDVRGEL